MEWVSVKDRLPESEDVMASIDVNFYDINNAVYSGYVTYMTKDDYRWYSYQHKCYIDDVIAWMPFPEPPKE